MTMTTAPMIQTMLFMANSIGGPIGPACQHYGTNTAVAARTWLPNG